MLHDQCISGAGAALRKAPDGATPETVLVEPAMQHEPIEGGRVYGNQRSTDANLTGVIGELAVQKGTGNIEQPMYLRGDRGYDVVSNGTTIE